MARERVQPIEAGTRCGGIGHRIQVALLGELAGAVVGAPRPRLQRRRRPRIPSSCTRDRDWRVVHRHPTVAGRGQKNVPIVFSRK